MQRRIILFGIIAIALALTGFLIAPRYLAPSNAITTSTTKTTTNAVTCPTGQVAGVTITPPSNPVSVETGVTGTAQVQLNVNNPNNCTVPNVQFTITPQSGLTCNSLSNNGLVDLTSATSGTVNIACSAITPGTYTVNVSTSQVGVTAGTPQTTTVTFKVTPPGTSGNQGNIGLGTSSITCTAGTTKTFTVNPSNLPTSLTGSLQLAVSVSPNNGGLTITGVPSTLSANSGPATITVNCATAGTYTVTVSATAGTLNLTGNITVKVLPASVSITPPESTSLTCTAGQTITATVNVNVNQGMAIISVKALPTTTVNAGIQTTVSPSSLKMSGPVTVTIHCMNAGSFTLNISAKTNYETVSTSLSVKVNST